MLFVNGEQIKTIDGMLFCLYHEIVKYKEPTNGYLRIRGHES